MAESNNAEAIREIRDIVQNVGGPRFIEGANTPYVVIPQNSKVEPLAHLIYNDHNPRPERIKASVTVLDSGSFVKYYQDFSDENSQVFADETSISVTAVLDYHARGTSEPRWGQHRLKLTLRQSEEWKRWTAKNNVHQSQTDFAEFLEQNGIDISRPAPGAVMEVARDLQATTEVEFTSGQRMQDGQRKFKYTETVNSRVGAGELAVPENFTLNIPVFVGGDRIEVQALLRFRVKEGHLVIWYTLVRPEEAIRSAFIATREKIAADLSITILNGTPSS